jgi:membrane-bound serine protease (ClpP class)
MDSDTLGYLLLAAALALFLVEVLLPTGGLVGLLGVAALVAGQIILDVPWWVIVLVVLLILGFGVFLTGKVYKAHKQDRVLTGWEELIGSEGEVRVALAPVGQLFVNGALWRAQVDEGAEALPVGARARVREVDGLTLRVEPL